MENPGSKFLHERQPTFHASREVEDVVDYLRDAGDSIPNDPASKISAYLGCLASRELANDGILTGDKTSINRQIKANIINTVDVPESFFDFQQRIAREQGHGDIQITSEMRHQAIEALQADQRAGLTKWAEYLSGDDGSYPDWFKYYTFSSVSKLGCFDKEKGEFSKRSRGTTATFPELNREALAYVFDMINQAKLQGKIEDIQDERLQGLLDSANFGKLYTYAIFEASSNRPEIIDETIGSWTKYDQTDNPQAARMLSNSIHGHSTGWCTAGESTAAAQLSMGDFYVYYSRDEDENDTIPRVAVRMQGGKVAEVRGIEPAQEMEPIMAEIVAEKLQELPGGNQYVQKAEDMKRLTAIDKKISTDANATLSYGELILLYELDHKVKGFGYEQDPRIGEIRSKRKRRDKPELVKLLPETIHEQLEQTFNGYLSVVEQLNNGQTKQQEALISRDQFDQIFNEKDKQWHENGTYNEVAERLIKDDVRFNLLVTPNLEITEEQLVALAESFGEKQPHSTYVWEDLYRKQKYSSKQWSGAISESPIRLGLIESTLDPRLYSKTVAEQRAALAKIQAEIPELNARVPSLLDDIVNWYTLRARGDELRSNDVCNKTYTRHFDLDGHPDDGGWLHVPYSYIRAGGRACLDYSYADNPYESRIMIG
jgi:hypothetical protein